MPHLRVLLAASAAILFPASAAMASDYEPPIIMDQIEEVVPVEIGSGWYLRGDVGYTFSSRFRNYENSFGFPGIGTLTYGEDNTAFFGGAGFGYHFTDYLRGDLTLNYLRREEAWGNFISDSDPTIGASGRIDTRMGYGLATAYVDLGTIAGFTPYVGAGIGTVYSRPKAKAGFLLPDGRAFGVADTRKDSFSFAYSLNAGAAYQLTENLSLDVGYQYLNAPNADYFSVDKPFMYDRGFDMHQIKVGLRYDLW